jgi:histidinol-phosphate phosphatase family protein
VSLVDVVVPTTRPRLVGRLLSRLDGLPGRVVVVDGSGRSPAAARNEGWRASTADWVAFLDDDVVPADGWVADLVRDLEGADRGVAGSQGRVEVPLSASRRPTDWERSVRGLEDARWATADMAYRRPVLSDLGGFDERFPRAYREDADLALRVTRAGYELARGERRVLHPVEPAGWLVSVGKQAGNADDVLMRAKHGARWRREIEAPPGRLRRHVAIAVLGGGGVMALAARRRGLAAAALAGWAGGTYELACARIRPGPHTTREIATMLATTSVLPFAAAGWSAVGWARHGRLALERRRTQAVLFDRDGTLVEDEPYNGDPAKVRPLPGARQAVARVRAAGLPVAVVTNQSGVGRGRIRLDDVGAVNDRVAALVGGVDAFLVCPHAPDAGCDCRKPLPALVLRAAERLGVAPESCVVIGDIGSDVEAAAAAGARGILVPTVRTRRGEVEAAPLVASSLASAVDLALAGRA